jgi:hypothetical protein
MVNPSQVAMGSVRLATFTPLIAVCALGLAGAGLAVSRWRQNGR